MDFISEFEKFFVSAEGKRYMIKAVSGSESAVTEVRARSYGELIGNCESFCREYMQRYGGSIDYIHGDEEALKAASESGCAGLILPGMEKAELFSSVALSGPFPKKSFSVGLGSDKRYYLECRKLK